MKNQKGSVNILLVIIAVVIIGGGTFYYVNNQDSEDVTSGVNINESFPIQEENDQPGVSEQENNTEEMTFCTTDAMQCPNGSYVGRTGPDCKFVCPEEPESTLEYKSRKDEIKYYDNNPVGYTDAQYSNIVGYDKTVGITMSIPAGVVPSIINDGSLNEVVAYRFEDGLAGNYNDAIAIFSCFEDGLPNIENNVSYVDFSEEKELEIFNFNNTEYYLINYENFFVLTSPKYSTEFKDHKLSGCGLVFTGKVFSEAHLSFVDGIKFIDSREDYLEKIYNKFSELYPF